jgi:hypothetical protein
MEMNIIEAFYGTLGSNDRDRDVVSQELIAAYQQGDDATKAGIDKALIAICDFDLPGLMKLTAKFAEDEAAA